MLTAIRGLLHGTTSLCFTCEDKADPQSEGQRARAALVRHSGPAPRRPKSPGPHLIPKCRFRQRAVVIARAGCVSSSPFQVAPLPVFARLTTLPSSASEKTREVVVVMRDVEPRGISRLGAWGQARWSLTLYPGAGEAGGCFVSASEVRRVVAPGQGADPERARAEAARRARAKIRRYAVANGLNRLGTLTYRGHGCHDVVQVRQDAGAFFRALRGETDRGRFPYVWVPEWHPGGHGLHLHFAVARFIHRSVIERAWGHGFIHIKLLSDLPIGSGSREEARRAAGYLSKYVSKTFEEGQGLFGRHRYEVGQGFQPVARRLLGRTSEEVLAKACELMGAEPIRRWSSDEVEGWDKPPAVWFAWA